MRNDKENIIVNKTFQFAIQIVAFCEELENNKKFASSLVQLVVCSVNALAEIRCN